MKRPHVVRTVLCDVGIEAMLLLNDVIDVIIRASCIGIGHTAKQEIRKVVVNFDS